MKMTKKYINDMMKNDDKFTSREALTILDCLVHTRGISENDQNALVSMKKKEKIIINQKKQTNIRYYFVMYL